MSAPFFPTSLTGSLPGAIVVGVDGTVGSDHALRFAAGLAAMTGHTLRAVIVVQPTVVPVGAFDTVAAFEEPDPFEASVRLERALVRVLGERAGTVERRVVVGSVSHRLIEESADASVLVVGQGSTALGARLFGTARQVVSRATCPVVVVPPSADSTTRLVGSDARGRAAGAVGGSRLDPVGVGG